MKKMHPFLATVVVSTLAVLAVDVQQTAATTSLAFASSETSIGGWDYAYTGDAASNGTGGTGPTSTGKLDGTFIGSSRNAWDGSAPGEIGPASAGDSPLNKGV